MNRAPLAPLLLLLVAVLGALPVLLAAEWQGTEARRVQIALEMVASGDWMVPTLGWEPTLTKPPLLYWIHGAMIQVGGLELVQHPWVFRLPSVLALWLVAWCAFGVVRRLFTDRAGWLAALAILCSPVLLHEAPRAEIDPPFAAVTAASLLLAALGVAQRRRGVILAAGLVAGLAWMLKAVPYLLFCAGPLLVWLRYRRGYGLLWFLLPMLAVPLCYYVPLLTGRVNPDEFQAIVDRETISRLSTWGMQHLTKTPGAVFRAVSVLLPMGLWWVFEKRRERRATLGDDQLLFHRMMVWGALLGLLILMAFPGRPTRYMLPAVPLFLAAVGPTLDRYWQAEGFDHPAPQRIVRGLQWVGVVALVASPFLPGLLGWAVLGPGVAFAVGGFGVRTPRDLLVYALLVPVLVGSTAFSARLQHQHTSSRSELRAATLLEEALRERDLLPDGAGAPLKPAGSLGSYGHIQSDLLLWTGCIPDADEFRLREPTTDWLLYEDHSQTRGEPVAPGYEPRVRIQTRPGRVSYVLAKRVGR